MLIILEGPDNSGKTTLANALRSNPSVDYWHPGGAPKSLEDEERDMQGQHFKAVMHWPEPLIMDRCTAISQQVYNADITRLVPRDEAVRKLLALPDVIVVYCRPSTDRLMRTDTYTWREGEDEAHKQKIITRAHEWINRYDNLMQTIPHISYDYDAPSGPVVRANLQEALRGNVEAHSWLSSIINFRRTW